MASRVSRAYVSAYDRSAVHVGRVRRQETRSVVADLTAVLGANTIASVTWRCEAPWVAAMSSAAISGKTTSVKASFQQGGVAYLKAEVTDSAGDIYSQVYEFQVADSPIFNDTDAAAGPYSLTVTA